jgi:hypothetical protein
LKQASSAAVTTQPLTLGKYTSSNNLKQASFGAVEKSESIQGPLYDESPFSTTPNVLISFISSNNLKHASFRAVEKGESPYIHVQYVHPFNFGAGRGTVAKPPLMF